MKYSDAELINKYLFGMSYDNDDIYFITVDRLLTVLHAKYKIHYIEMYSASATEYAIRIHPYVSPSRYPAWNKVARFKWGRADTVRHALIKAITLFLRFKHNR